MTTAEFRGPFGRLCTGLDYQSTPEQLNAWYQRIGHITLSVWSESVTTLLCDGRKGFLPKLEHVLAVVDAEAEQQRKAAVERDKPKAQSALQRLTREANEEDRSRIPTPGTPLFACIKAFASRAEAWRRLAMIKADMKHTELERERERIRIEGFLRQAEADIAKYGPLIHDEDAARLVRKYETPDAA
jgi:hypothetical protein